MPTRQIAQSQISDTNTDKAFHLITDGFEHPADLSVYPLPQDYAQACRRRGMKPLDARAFAIEKNSFR